MTADRQEGIIRHELVHVERQGWLFKVVEEVVLEAFWFQPTGWWVVDCILQGREQAVDGQVVMSIH
jgi:beta-lactamase regulating signal transducer with metallopeptidase domain